MKLSDLPLENIREFTYKHGRDNDSWVLICRSIRHSITNKINALPIFVVKDGNFVNVNSHENTIKYNARIREMNGDFGFVTLDEKFAKYELFKVNSFQENANVYDEPELPYFVHGNNTEKISTQIIEIYDGIFDLDTDYFIPNSKVISILLKNFYDSGKTHFFYVKQNDLVYGPFKINYITGELVKLSALSYEQEDTIYQWDWGRISEEKYLMIDFEDEYGTSIQRIFSSCWLPVNNAEKITFVSEDNLLNWLKRRIDFSKNYSKNDYITFRKIVDNFSKLDVELNEKHIHRRILDILNSSDNNFDENMNFVENVEKSRGYKIQIENLQSEISSFESNKRQIEDNIGELKNQQAEMLSEIELLEQQINEKKQTKEDLQKQKFTDIVSENNELKQLIEKNADIKEEYEKIEKYRDLKKIESDIDAKKLKRKHIEDEIRELEDTIDKLSNEFIDKQKKAHDKLGELVKAKIHFDFISGRDLSQPEKHDESLSENVKVASFMSLNKEDFISHEKFLLSKVDESLKKVNRRFDKDFLANILISLFQNTFTIFAGAPGTGKTSLARIISNIFAKDKKKQVEVSVSKGWTSYKDFIGFYNPLSKEFVPANQAMYDLLVKTDMESRSLSYFKQNMGYVVLDEANLSPIEHYWSLFYNLTDTKARKNSFLTLDLGKKEFQYPNNIRFIGTINIDHTTEELSPRIIDRANIIRVPFSNNTVNYVFDSNEEITPIDFTFEDAIKLFNLRDFEVSSHQDSDLDREQYKTLRGEYENVKEHLRKLQVSISPRIDIAFIDYTITSLKFMSPFKAFDFFIAQRLLPKISLQGEAYQSGLESFLAYLINIFREKGIENSESVSILRAIIDKGKQVSYFNNYNYFLLY